MELILTPVVAISSILTNGILSVFVGISAKIFEASLIFSLGVNSSGNFYTSEIIKEVWVIARDIANICFIFIILYIAIATILRASNFTMKQTLAKVLIMAVLINFSFAITNLVIDLTNVLALEFYNAIIEGGGGVTSFAITLMDNVGVHKYLGQGKNAVAIIGDPQATAVNVMIITVLSATFLLVAIFVFLAGSFFFVTRTVSLIFLLITSPLAFLGMALPGKAGTQAGEWKKKLLDRALFAPAFMFLLYFTMKIAANGNLFCLGDKKECESAGFLEEVILSIRQKRFEALDVSVIFLNYFVLITLLIGSLIVAKQFGAKGADTANKWLDQSGNWAKGVAQRNTIGRAANFAANSPAAQKLASRFPVMGGGALNIVSGWAGGFKKKAEEEAKTGMGLSDKAHQATYFANASATTQDEMLGKMSGKDKAKMYGRIKLTDPVAAQRILDHKKDKDETKRLIDAYSGTDMSKVRPGDLANMDDSILMDPANLSAMVDGFGPEHAKKISEIGGDVGEAFFKEMASRAIVPPGQSPTEADVVAGVGASNKALAKWLSTPQGQMTIANYIQ